MKRSRPSCPYVPVFKLHIKAAKKQHDNGETHEYNVVEDTLECDDVAEASKSDDIADKTSESSDVAEDTSEHDDIVDETSESSSERQK